jgi:glucose/arabinose dehydrogenase
VDPDAGRIGLTKVASGLAGPLAAVAAPGDANGLYVLENDTGRIVRIDLGTGAQSTFLDVPQNELSFTGERGAIGLAFHPDYAASGRLLVNLTRPDGDIAVIEYARSSADPLLADPIPLGTIIEVPHRTCSNHNAGSLAFGPLDGLPYIAVGDGGGPNNPLRTAQSRDSLLGKILRIDVDGDDFPDEAARDYAIPAGNPLVGAAGRDEIWDLGLRNP